jgi:hypothetical protein
MQNDSFKFVHVSVKQKTEKAARVRVFDVAKPMSQQAPPHEIWLPYSQCSPNLKEAPRGQTLTVGVREWLIPDKGLAPFLTSGPATVLPVAPKPKSPWDLPTVAAKPAPIDWASMAIPSVTEQKAAVPEFPWMRPDRIAGASAQPIATESGQEPPDYDPLDDLL